MRSQVSYRFQNVWTGENDSKTLGMDTNFFEVGEKRCGFKRMRIVWTGPKTNCNFATHNKYLISFLGVWPRLPFFICENQGPKTFSDTEQN